MRAAVVLAALASVGPALAVPSTWGAGNHAEGRGGLLKEVKETEDEIAALEKELKKLQGEEGSWGGRQGGHRRPGGSYSWGAVPPYPQQSSSSSSSSVEVSPVTTSAPSTTAPAPYTAYSPSGNSVSPVPYGNYTWSGYVSSPAETIVYVTDFTTVYTTVCPYETQVTSAGSTMTSAGVTTSTVTSSYKTTITTTKSASSPSSPTAPVYVESTSSGSPVVSPISESSESFSSTITPVPWGYYTPPGYHSTPVEAETTVYVTDFTTVFTTVCPYASTYKSGSTQLTSSGITTSTITSSYKTTITSTISHPSSASSPISPISESSTKGSSSKKPSAPGYAGSSSSPAGPIGGSTSSSASSAPTAPVYGGSSSSGSSSSPVSPASGSTSKSSPTAPVYGGSSTASSSSAPSYGGSSSSSSPSASSSPVSGSSTPVGPVSGSSTSETRYTTYSTTCTESGTITIHTHSAPITTVPYPTGNATATSYGSGSSSFPSGPITTSGSSTSSASLNSTASSSPSETSYTTYSTTCTENGTVTIHTHSAPITGNSSSTIGPVTTSASSGIPSYSANATTSASSYPTAPISTSASSGIPSYSGNVTSSASSYPTAPITTSASSGAPSNSANSTSSTSISETSYTTYSTTCTENGTAVVHTHSAPITGNSSSTVGPVTTSASSGSSSGFPSYSANATTSASSYPTAPITTSSIGTVSPSPSANSTSTSASSTSSASSTATCVPCKGQPGKNPGQPTDDEPGYCGYTVEDNYYDVMPITCRTVEYYFEIQNTTVSPDGVPRGGLIINGQMPGPVIEANWGDTIIVHVTNSMENNGSTIHWHGMRQNYTNEMDGVASITQCPIAPGESMTYTFKADNYGTSWYHSHYSLQAYMGIFGPMIIHGPTSDDKYDAEQMITLQDWNHVTVDQMYDSVQNVGPSPPRGNPTLDTGLINGMNVWGADGAAGTTGQRFTMNVTQGQTYMLRLLNTAISSTFKFYIDGHSMTVISADYVPIVPYETEIVSLNPGQRYNVLVTFDQPINNYWMRSDNQASCNTVTQGTNIKGIVRYEGASTAVPTSTAYTYTDSCEDEPYASLVPVLALNAGPEEQLINETVTIGANGGSPNLYKWSLDGTTFDSQYGDPTLLSVYNNGTIPTYSGRLAIEAPNLGEWVYVIIESPIPNPHPIHLHGHDFYVLAQGPGLYTGQALNLVNPPRRDVALMPAAPPASGGFLVLAFYTDNPGVWLLHCHIGWHNAMGFALQIIENLEGIADTVSAPEMLQDTCSTYNAYATEYDIVVPDSGV